VRKIANLNTKQLEALVKWSKSEEYALQDAQKKAMQNYLRENGLISSEKLTQKFGAYLENNKQLMQKYIERKRLVNLYI